MGEVGSHPAITFENNDKIRREKRAENWLCREVGGGKGTGVEHSLRRKLLIYIRLAFWSRSVANPPHEVLVFLELPFNVQADITDFDQLFNAMTAYAGFDELDTGSGRPCLDTVVHFAAVRRIAPV
jgi:hypothetical protein